jgi:hypothetical protein
MLTDDSTNNAGGMREPRVLDDWECRRLMGAGGVGRVAFTAAAGPQIVPINYALHGEAVVFRTTPQSLLGALGWSQRLAFEVDHLDHARCRGWSVIASGRGELIEDDLTLSSIRGFWDPRPWAGGTRLVYIKLRWDTLTGRQIGEGWFGSDEPPVRRAPVNFSG